MVEHMSVEEYRALNAASKGKSDKGRKQFKTMHEATRQHLLDSRSREPPVQGKVMALIAKQCYRSLQNIALRYQTLCGGDELIEATALVEVALRKLDELTKGG